MSTRKPQGELADQLILQEFTLYTKNATHGNKQGVYADKNHGLTYVCMYV
jgi:hypothetical protein